MYGAAALVPFMRLGLALNALADSTPRPLASSSAGAYTSGFSRPFWLPNGRVGPHAEYPQTSCVAVLYAPTLIVRWPVAQPAIVWAGSASAAWKRDCLRRASQIGRASCRERV